jgi:hypothetical protein
MYLRHWSLRYVFLEIGGTPSTGIEQRQGVHKIGHFSSFRIGWSIWIPSGLKQKKNKSKACMS